MKTVLKNALFTFTAIIILCLTFMLPASAADDGWTYANKLPSGVTTAKYTIQYNNVYKKTAKTSPGAGWVNKGLAYSQYENYGEPYTSDIELPTSNTRVVVSYWYYHYCSNNMGVRVNFALSGPYNHYDGISPGNFYEAATYIDEDDARYKSYRLKYYDGSDVYCSSGFSCDGKWGSHGRRSYLWYKTTRYQDKIKVDYYNFEKQSGWTSKADPSASSYTVRYKLNHTHSYSAWKVSQKATFTKDGSQYRTCTGCSDKQTSKIAKLSSVKLSATAYGYNGKARKPSVTIKNSAGTKIDPKHYTVKYSSGRKNIGTYKVTVKLKGSYYSGSKTLKFKVVPPTVKNLKATVGKNQVTLKWSKVTGSNIKYRVYSYNTSTKEIKLLDTTTKTKITYKSLKSGTKYSYVVKASRKIKDTTYYSNQSSVVTVQPYGKPAKISGLKASTKTSTSITLKWNKASGNKVRYYVYSYNSSKDKYTKLGKTTSTSYTIKDLKPNKTYKYAVRAYSAAGDGYYGTMSAVYSVKTNPKLTSPSVGTVTLSTERKMNNVLVKWTANSSATGYEIYRSATGKDGSFVCIKKIASPAANNFTDTTVLPAKTYYYKVRSYKISGSESAYGSYSAVKKITTYSAWKTNLYVTDLSFSFSNSSRDFGYPDNYRIPFSSYQYIFGNTALAKEMFDRYDGVWGGSCNGMATASALFNVRTSGIKVTDFKSSALKPSDLGIKDYSASLGINLTTFIEALQVSQFSSYLYENTVLNNLDKLLNAVNNVPFTGKPVIIGIYGNDGGHALLGYYAYKPNNSEIRIQVYDSNHPNTNKELILYTNASGKITGWFYDLGFYEPTYWGTGYPKSNIDYIEYDIYSTVWTNRAKFNSNIAKTNTLIVNSEDISIYDENNNLIAVMSDGKITEGDDDIYVVEKDSMFGSQIDTLMLQMPTDETYTIINNDDDVATFEATMVNVDRSAQVSTEADSITFTVSDNEEVNSVYVEAEKNEDYSIVLDYSDSLKEEDIEVIGTGDGDTVNVAQEGEELSLDNCEEAEINVGEIK